MKGRQITQKKASELSFNEKEEITNLIKRYYPNSTQDYFDNRVSVKCEDDIVLLKNAKNILGVSYYKVDKLVTPFTSKVIPVIKFGQALKKEDYPKSVIWKLGNWYAQRNISYFYPAKEVVGVSTISSPKVFEHFTKLFPNHFPNSKYTSDNLKITNFLNEYFNQNQSLDVSIGTDFCIDYPGVLEKEITSDWEKKYKAKDDSINELFISFGIIKFSDGKIYQTRKTLVACGYRTPLTFVRRKKHVPIKRSIAGLLTNIKENT
ncbi:MAG: hypothetical protein ACPGU9_05595 [Flavobacteriaceae bacterium]